ncbi:MAG: hypothetical protein JW874_10175 [Spirochaetales bacterium]|nr:hypothetical protein [Spirochaetales bacterium]
MAYKNINAAIFCTRFCVESLADNKETRERLSLLDRHIRYSKVWLETYRGAFGEHRESLEECIVPDEKIEAVRKLFLDKGIKVSGAITTTGFSRNGRFKSLCYSSPSELALLEKIVRKTALLFDEIILDDFYFTNCKCEACLKAKGNKSWDSFRMEQMCRVSEDVIRKTARAVNPKVKLIIKYPNWYEHYQKTGYDTEHEPKIFDYVYTGVETRDETFTQQNTQKYLSYFVMRYLENLSEGKNAGGWLDSFDCRNKLEDYTSQILMTLFAKAREVTFFCLHLLLFRDPFFIPLAGFVLEELDRIYPELGNPVGIATYKPYHSSGEDFLHTYLGCLGIPFEPYAAYPEDAHTVFLTESAAADEKLIGKMKKSLKQGKTVIITSGLLRALESRGIDEICSVRTSNTKIAATQFEMDMFVSSYFHYTHDTPGILLPELLYHTNDVFPLAAGRKGEKSVPFLLEDAVYDSGRLIIMTIPDNMADLYNLPVDLLDRVREIFNSPGDIYVKKVSQTRVFLYDNDRLIVQSGLPHNHKLCISTNKNISGLTNLLSRQEVPCVARGERNEFELLMLPAGFHVLKITRAQ